MFNVFLYLETVLAAAKFFNGGDLHFYETLRASGLCECGTVISNDMNATFRGQ